jgi:nitroreductase
MDLIELIKSRRSVRLFKQETIGTDILLELVDSGRYAPSAANRQPLEYIIVTEAALCEKTFEQLAWAAYVQPRRTHPAGKKPTAYIVVLINSEAELSDYGRVDAAAAIQNILLAAKAKGIGSCWLGSVQRETLTDILDVPEKYVIDSVVALGFADEEPLVENCKGDSIKYYLDKDDRLHVPKRLLKKVTHINKFGGAEE